MHDASGAQDAGLVKEGPGGAGRSEPEAPGADLWYADRDTRLAAARAALRNLERAQRAAGERGAGRAGVVREPMPDWPGEVAPAGTPFGLTPWHAGPVGAPTPGPPAGAAPGDDAALEEMEYAVLDVETTGGSAAFGHRITEVGIVCLTGRGEFRGELRTLVNPGRAIPPAISRLTNISQAMVDAAPGFRDIAERVAAALRDRVLVAHNAAFDWRFLHGEFELCGRRLRARERLCTVRMARRLVPEVRRRSLDALCNYFAIPNEARHRAWGDARATAALLVRLIARAEERAAPTLADLRALMRPAARASRRRSALPRSMEWA